MLKKEEIINYLKSVKSKYEKEGLYIKAIFGSYSRDEANENSDIDILVEATPKFASTYGFRAIRRLKEIEAELSSKLGVPVDLADSSGMGKTAKKFIINKALYV